MKTTKKITVSGMVVALSAIFLIIGSYAGSVDLLFEVVASLLAVFVYIELGSPYTWLVWPATTLTVAFLPNGISIAGLYIQKVVSIYSAEQTVLIRFSEVEIYAISFNVRYLRLVCRIGNESQLIVP